MSYKASVQNRQSANAKTRPSVPILPFLWYGWSRECSLMSIPLRRLQTRADERNSSSFRFGALRLLIWLTIRIRIEMLSREAIILKDRLFRKRLELFIQLLLPDQLTTRTTHALLASVPPLSLCSVKGYFGVSEEMGYQIPPSFLSDQASFLLITILIKVSFLLELPV